ncbi:roundabout homolog 1 isoform X2 [Oryzias melastigma]|uniref:roundabout homolog 1 isoform X2 n=1 Tax=Oryzias melastigma TaxID=30732 RepID=UPI00168D3A44|nr:roundabout homolog 1 isoform X2 [Oryzias melastigma]
MRVTAWFLLVYWLFAYTELSQQCRLHHICPKEAELDRRSATRVKEQTHHGSGHQHKSHRSRQQHRRVSFSGLRVHGEDIPPLIVHQPSDVVVKAGNPATLSCRADGSPKPTIQWLRNAQPLRTREGDGQLQPMVLSDGNLFFLSVGGARRGSSHEGVYSCVASNSAGKAVSRNASLHIAALQDEFSEQPKDVEVAEGELAVLNCVPPVGHPAPNVMWKKDGIPINITDHRYIELSGKLIIASVEKNHSGAYVCVATNIMGMRESRAARLSVLAKPVLTLKPENASVMAGDSAHFYCQATGDPPPAVVWSREGGALPNGRYLVKPDHTLQLFYITAQDAGKYTCTAANDAGKVTASAHLLVEVSANTEQRDFHKELSALRVTLENVTVVASGSNISLVQWEPQNVPSQPHYLDGFEVLYRSVLPSSSDWAAKKVTMPKFQTQVGPLKRGYKYEFKVRPYGSNLYGRESNTQDLRVPEIVPSAPPSVVSMTVNHDQNNTIRLSWEPPPPETHNGIIQGYQVWCVESQEQQYQNWTVDSSQISLNVSNLKAGGQYWIIMAAVNGAGVGTLSDPQEFVINPKTRSLSESDKQSRDLVHLMDLLHNPVVIGFLSAFLCCTLVVAAVFLFRRHSKTGKLLPGPGKMKGGCRLANEDLIIKHRMAAPDSPWISGSWRPAFKHKYQDLWAQGQKQPGIKSTSLPDSSKRSNSRDCTVPMVTDRCGVYGTFYVDLTGSSLKTFNSPGRSPKMPHGLPLQQGQESIQIFPQSPSNSSSASSRESLPWKQAIRPQPRMGVLRECWEKKPNKQELHAVNSVPVLPSRSQACVYKQRLSHTPGPDCCKAAGGSRLLHCSASLHFLDMLPPPPVEDKHSLSSDEGHSTKLTEDAGSVRSVCPASGPYQPAGPTSSCPSLSPRSAASRSMSLDDDGTLTSQEATVYLELSPKPERRSVLPEQRPSLSQYHSSALGSICGPVCSSLLEESATDQLEFLPAALRHARLQSSPSSCYSEWDSSLWNTWSSVMDSNLDSARTSLISSVDSCYTTDSATFAHMLAMAAESRSGASLTDLSPPASPLSALYPSQCGDSDSFGEPVPVWDWSVAWMEEMEAQYRALYPARFPSET